MLFSFEILGDTRVIVGEGMPKHKSPTERGNLYIKFNIEYPKPGSLSDSQLQQLETILTPTRIVPQVTSEMVKIQLTVPQN